jgi:hypothetical protein
MGAWYLRKNNESMEQFEDNAWAWSGHPKLIMQLGSTNTSLPYTRPYDTSGDMWSKPNGSPIERQLEWLPKELVRVEDYVEVRDGKVFRYPSDLED